MSREQDLLAVVRTAAHQQSVARREARKRIYQQRQRFTSTLQDSRKQLGQRLLAAAGIGQAELDLLAQREEETVRKFLQEERHAMASHIHPTNLNPPPQLLRRSPFPDAPQLGYKSVTLDTATFIGPPVDDQTGDSPIIVAPDPITPGHNFVRAFAEGNSSYQYGFDPGHLGGVYIEFFFTFTADSDVQVNAASFVDWNGGYILLASWYPFDGGRAQASFTLGMDVIVVNAEGGLVGMTSAAPDEGFDKSIDVGFFDFSGAYDSFIYSSNSAFFINGISVNAGDQMFFRIWAELDVYTLSIATALVEFYSDNLGINVPGVFIGMFPPIG